MSAERRANQGDVEGALADYRRAQVTCKDLRPERRMRLAVRIDAGGRQVARLAVTEAVNLTGIVEESIFEVPLEGGGLYATLTGPSELATRVRAVTEPDALRPQLALDIDRESRDVRRSLFGRPTHRLFLDGIDLPRRELEELRLELLQAWRQREIHR